MKGFFNYERAYGEYTASYLQDYLDDNIQYVEIWVNFIVVTTFFFVKLGPVLFHKRTRLVISLALCSTRLYRDAKAKSTRIYGSSKVRRKASAASGSSTYSINWVKSPGRR